MTSYPIHVDQNPSFLTHQIKQGNYDTICVVADTNTQKHCLPTLQSEVPLDYNVIIIDSGEQHKNVASLQLLWQQMLSKGMSRKSLVINLGGGVIGDMGGFAAATYMRGVDFVQIPTTLLSMVDASVGGKLGIDFNNVKNAVGLFEEPKMVWVDTSFLETLPEQELRSGFAEIVKHSLVADSNMWKDIQTNGMPTTWSDIVKRNIDIKANIVSQDPREGGKRKILNYGHTMGHGLESLLLDTDQHLLHGIAVAYGMVLENDIAVKLQLIPSDVRDSINQVLIDIFKLTPLNITAEQYQSLMHIIKKDKKNVDSKILMSLVELPGTCHYNMEVTPNQIDICLQQSKLINLA